MADRRTVLREAIRFTLLRADGPLRTTTISQAVIDQDTTRGDVERELRAMERAGEVQLAGRAGTAATAERLWQLATATGTFNQAFADLLAEFERDSDG